MTTKLSAVPQMSEDQLQKRVIDLARMTGWRVVHIRAAVMAGTGRWMVPYEGDAGLPDLILARDGRVILAELKSSTGKATAAQLAWLAAAGGNGRLWRPSSWPEIQAELTAEATA